MCITTSKVEAVMNRTGSCTHVGRRENNEDALLIDEELGLFAVADGIGGHCGGEVASRLAVETLRDCLCSSSGADDTVDIESMLRHALREVVRQIARQSVGDLGEMATTLSAVLVIDGIAHVVHVGDSRVYLLRAGRLSQVSRDHSLVNELRQAVGEVVTPSMEFELGHIVTQYIGAGHVPSPDIDRVQVLPGDRLLICSDGLSDVLSDTEIRSQLTRQSASEIAEDLVWDAYNQGGHDNISAVVVDVV